MSVLPHWYPGDHVVLIVISVLIQVTLMSAIALLLARYFAARKPEIKHGIVACALMCCLLSPVMTVMFDWAGVRMLEYRITDKPLSSTISVDRVEDSVGAAILRDSGPDIRADDSAAAVAMTQASDLRQVGDATTPSRVLPVLGGAAWLTYWLVALILLSRLVHGWRSVHRLRRDSRPLTNRRFTTILSSVTASLGMTRAPALACSGSVCGPVTIGMLRPMVLLPETLIHAADQQQLRQLLLHECAHVLRRDCFTGLIQRFAEILYWPHPLIHVLNRQLAEAREEVCDNYVLLSSEPSEYGRTLLKLAETLQSPPRITTAVGLLSRRENLQQRIERILDSRRTLMTQMRYSTSIGLAVGFLSLMVAIAGTRVTDAQEADVVEIQATEQSPATKVDDSRLNEKQRMFRDWTNDRYGSLLDESPHQSLTDAQRATAETEWIGQLSEKQGRQRIPAINGLAGIRSRKAVEALSRVAFARVDKDNRDRWMAVRALGLLGDQSVVPGLVHLTYHYNLNTRLWAQISLVRLTGQNFAGDLDAWRKWWNDSGKQPAIDDEVITWTTHKEWSDPASMAETEQRWLASVKGGENVSDAPRIVSTSPKVGATGVDPSTTEITVTFDRDMAEGFSWTGGGEKFPPSPDGAKAVWRDKRTCVLPVKLKSAHFYRVGINSTSYKNFRSVSGVPAKPSAIYFTTQGAGDEVKSQTKLPNIIKMQPENGSLDVDPGLTELRVTFDMAMAEGFSWTGGGEHFPKGPAGKRPVWSKDRKTCVLPVTLKPNWEYRLGLNSRSHKNFQSAAGIPLDPVVYSFKTRED